MARKLKRSVAPARAGSGSSTPPEPGSGAGPGAGRSGTRRSKGRRGRRISQQMVTDFTVQMATLAGASIPVVRALVILEGQAKPGPFKSILGELVEDVSGGAPLSEALEKQERAFDPLYASMVRAGETGGVLDTVLERLAMLRERTAELRNKVKSAMLYPVIVLLISLVVVSVVITYVIPKFMAVFQSFDVELPGVTQLLLDVSGAATTYWYLFFGIPIALVVAHMVLMRGSTGYRHFVHKLLLGVPYLGVLLARSLIAAFARTFGTLVQAGVPHLDALEIARDTTDNEVMFRSIDEIRRVVREGETIARPMQEQPVFDDLVTNMVDVGEQTGELDSMLVRVADAYDVEVSRKIDSLFKIIEPLLLVFVAVFVGFIVVALFLPLTEIMSTAGAR